MTGAGISRESGIPTFRDADGYWKGLDPKVMSSVAGFRADPCTVWRWYLERRAMAGSAQPNAAHHALSAAAARHGRLHIVTQNVDGLHERSAEALHGIADRTRATPLTVHGSLFQVKCLECGKAGRDPGHFTATSVADLPKCVTCGGLLRPAIVWFGEQLEASTLERMQDWSHHADVALVIGTSATVMPSASVPMMIRGNGGSVIEVNTAETELTPYARVSIRGQAGTVLPALLDGLWPAAAASPRMKLRI